MRIIEKLLKSWLNFFLYGQNYEKQKVPRTSHQSLFGLQNTFRKIPFLLMQHLGNFDNAIQSGLWATPEITFANSCNPMHNVIIIPISPDPLNLKIVEREGKNYKKLNISRMEGVFFNEIIPEMLSFGKTKNREHKINKLNNNLLGH